MSNISIRKGEKLLVLTSVCIMRLLLGEPPNFLPFLILPLQILPHHADK